jgi:hypothetical protein
MLAYAEMSVFGGVYTLVCTNTHLYIHTVYTHVAGGVYTLGSSSYLGSPQHR